ncbi:hypothetical protein BJY04DRAFT_225093 [Aspergillus karnatakaensis]|uniref:F-box protein n=1 Tax=Aspergillus karnatakaensis TaxID=1810916 RepID=UPI003CCE3D90
MAMMKVLQLTELLEPILLNLPMRDLLLMQRVCRGWKDLILSSCALQLKLFLLTPRAGPQPEATAKPEINPLLQEMFPGFFIHLKRPDWGTLDDPDGNLSRQERRDMKRERHLNMQNTKDTRLESQEWYIDTAKREAVLRPEASWRKMFPSHPPPRLGPLHSLHHGCGCAGQDLFKDLLCPRYEKVNQDPGARMWLIWDATMFVLDDFPEGVMYISWWRRPVEGEGFEKRWILEMLVSTEHHWPCYRASTAYRPSGLKIGSDDDMIEYPQYEDYMTTINDYEAPPISVMRKYVRDAGAKVAAEGLEYGYSDVEDEAPEDNTREDEDTEDSDIESSSPCHSDAEQEDAAQNDAGDRGAANESDRVEHIAEELHDLVEDLARRIRYNDPTAPRPSYRL